MVRNMVRVYIAKITPLLIEENYRAYYRKIPAWRQEKADKLRFKEDKARSVGAWILWEKIKKAGQVTARGRIQPFPFRGLCAVRL